MRAPVYHEMGLDATKGIGMERPQSALAPAWGGFDVVDGAIQRAPDVARKLRHKRLVHRRQSRGVPTRTAFNRREMAFAATTRCRDADSPRPSRAAPRPHVFAKVLTERLSLGRVRAGLILAPRAHRLDLAQGISVRRRFRVRHGSGHVAQSSTILPQSPLRMISKPSRYWLAGRRWVMTLRTLSPLSSIAIILCQVSNISRP
jgi:hypothetical protein